MKWKLDTRTVVTVSSCSSHNRAYRWTTYYTDQNEAEKARDYLLDCATKNQVITLTKVED